MRSKFTFAAYLVSLAAIFLPVLLGTMAVKNNIYYTAPFVLLIVICVFFLFVWLWKFFGELRTKTISIEIEENLISINRYLGLGFTKRFELKNITGFKTSILSSKSGSYEYLYLMMGDRKVAKLSAFYHSNYKQLKSYLIAKNIKFIGMEPFSNMQELKDVFSR